MIVTASSQTETPQPSPARPEEGGYWFSKPRRSRGTIIDLLGVVAGDARPGYLLCDFDMTYSCSLLEHLRERGIRATITSVLIKAIAIAQRTHAMSRTESIPFGSLVTYGNIVAGFTVERTVDGQPTVFLGEIEHPDQKSIEQIASELKRYASEPIDTIQPLRLQGLLSRMPAPLRRLILTMAKIFPPLRLQFQKASFGLTSLGKFGVSTLLSPCLCSSTFGIGEMEERPVIVGSEIEVQKQLTVSYNFDIRAFDYAQAADFLSMIRQIVEGSLDGFLNEDERLLDVPGCLSGAERNSGQ
ncbi:MAG: 2-oxo acid dehydrogenase subunit E2 [Candidatus Obscuribacterales bacterium]